MEIIYAVVKGHGRFPVDMLRYDSCSPASEHDSYAIVNTFEKYDDYEITVKKLCPRGCLPKDNKFTVARWESFGCKLESVDSHLHTYNRQKSQPLDLISYMLHYVN